MINKTIQSAKWSLINTYAEISIKFIFTVAIIRILTPHDYGIVAYTGIFIAVGTFMSDGGFGAALIQKQDADQVDYSTAWIFNMGVSIIFIVIYIVSSGIVANYFQEPALKWVLRATSINLLLNAICYVHIFKLIKAVEFRPQAIINISSSTISGLLGLLFARFRMGYWALVIMSLSSSLFRMAGYLCVTKWRPSIIFDIQSFRNLFGFGSKIFVQGLLESIFREIYSLAIGKTYNTNNLGLYSRGYKFYEIFIINTGIAFNKVLYPTMAKRSIDQNHHNESYYKYYNILFFLIAPLSLFLILLSKPIIIWLLTSKWQGAIPYMQLSCFAGFVFILIYFNSSTLLSINQPKIFLRMDITQKALLLLALIITININIKAVIIGWLVVYYIYYIYYEWIMSRYGLSNLDKYMNMIKVLLALIPSIIIFTCVKQAIQITIIAFILQIILMPIVYIIVGRIYKLSAYQELSEILRPSLPSKIRWLI